MIPSGIQTKDVTKRKASHCLMTTLDKRMACYSIGWTNIMAVYELEEIVKWKANSCRTFRQWCRKFAAGHEITIEVCKFLYESNNLDFYHQDSFSSQFYSICKIYFL